MKVRTLGLFVFCCLGFVIYSVSPVSAQSTFDPLSLPMGARSLAMGGVYAAFADDADVVFNNPAGLGEIDTLKATSMSGSLLEDVNYVMLGGTYSLGNRGAIGLGYTGAFISGLDLRDGNGTFSAKANFSNSVTLVSFGQKLSQRFSLGAALKYYNTSATENTSGNGGGWNLDLGILQSGWDWVSFGLVGQNLLSSSRIVYQNGASESLQPKVRGGARFYLLGSQISSAVFSTLNLTAAFDAVFALQSPNPLETHYGLELWPNQFLALRAGFDQNNLTAGLGLKIYGLGLNYAYHSFGGFAGNNTNFFSITFEEYGWEPEGVFPSVASK